MGNALIGEEYRHNMYLDAIDKWGKHFQILMAIEEMSELIQILIHSERKNRKVKYREVASEIADVKIMLEQLETIFSCSDLVREEMQSKLLRLEKMLEVKPNSSHD